MSLAADFVSGELSASRTGSLRFLANVFAHSLGSSIPATAPLANRVDGGCSTQRFMEHLKLFHVEHPHLQRPRSGLLEDNR